MEIGKQITSIALSNGASLAGIASVEALRESPAHVIYPQMPNFSGIGTVKEGSLAKEDFFKWPTAAKSALVIALEHSKEEAWLDWWDGRGTPGNRRLMEIIKQTARQVEDETKLTTHRLHYYVEKGGVFLKDAAALAGLGCIGAGNMLVTPEYGPRVRLRALFIEAEIPATGPIDFDPCADCEQYCRKVCPEKAMHDKASAFETPQASTQLPARDGFYDREICNIRMEKDIAASKANDSGEQSVIKYCRKCEWVCPAGKKQSAR